MHDTRLWRVIRHYTKQALERRDLSGVRNVGFDETASKRGHDYVSVFVDLDTSKVIFATEGKDSSPLGRFKTFLENTAAEAKTSSGCVATCRKPSSKGLENTSLERS